jgi:hypothetical protein
MSHTPDRSMPPQLNHPFFILRAEPMQRIAPMLIIGTITASSMFTLFVGSQLQQGQCAEFSLPLNVQFSLGKTCQASRSISSR